jgi:hypothetical protein
MRLFHPLALVPALAGGGALAAETCTFDKACTLRETCDAVLLIGGGGPGALFAYTGTCEAKT